MEPSARRLFVWPQVIAAVLIIPCNFVLWVTQEKHHDTMLPFYVLCLAQFILGVWGAINGVRVAATKEESGRHLRSIFGVVFGALAALGAPAGAFLSVLAGGVGGFGGAWGRPLRVKGRQLHPELTQGSEWTAGLRPDPRGLDEPTRRALEALWLHDAQKEHASVPAFSRISWLLAAVGAPAELMVWSHRAAIEEIDHAQRCFALAAGYGGRSFTVEPMPDLLLGGLDDVKDPLVTLAVESLKDGCLLEDFNADVAAKCATVCEEPVTRGVLQQIDREERSHADFSWALLAWLLKTHRARVAPAIERACAELEQVRRPTSATPENQRLVEAADLVALRRHGRLADAEWAACWNERLHLTRARARALLGVKLAA